LRLQVGSVIIIGLWIERLSVRGRNDFHPRNKAVFEKLPRAQSRLGQHGILVERFTKHLSGIVAQGRLIIVTAQSSRGANTTEKMLRGAQPRLQPSHQAGEVRASRPVEGMQFIDDEEA